jgi:predicted PurR-regulated permease PerM
VSADSQTTNVTRYILIGLALLAVAVLIWQVAEAFVIAFGGIVFGTVLHALIAPLQRLTGWSRRLCLVTVVLVLLIVGGLLGWLFGRQATTQFVQMREQLPAAIEKFQTWIGESDIGRMAIDWLKETANGGKAPAAAGGAASALITGLGHLLLIAFAGIYFAANPKLYRNGALRLLPPSRRGQVGRALDDAGVALHKWLVAQLIVMAAVGVMTGAGLALIGVPLSLSLGLIAGLLEFVPVVGPIVAAIPGVLLAFAAGPQTAMYAAILYLVVQQLESNVLTPLIQRWAVALPPVIALLSIVACGLLFGVLGVIFATPMAVVVLALVQHLYVEDTLENNRGAKSAR